jgi:hypothetical protein
VNRALLTAVLAFVVSGVSLANDDMANIIRTMDRVNPMEYEAAMTAFVKAAKAGDIEAMVKLTSPVTRKQQGDDHLRKMYAADTVPLFAMFPDMSAGGTNEYVKDESGAEGWIFRKSFSNKEGKSAPLIIVVLKEEGAAHVSALTLDQQAFQAQQAPVAAKDLVVAVDPSNPAYTVLIAIPADRQATIDPSHPAAKTLAFVPLETFVKDPKRHLSKRVLVASYSTPRFYERLGQLVAKYPGTPIGLAFNGGIAITRNDYTHAERMHAWSQDQKKYREIQGLPENIPKDPIHPEAHFGPLLGPGK